MSISIQAVETYLTLSKQTVWVQKLYIKDRFLEPQNNDLIVTWCDVRHLEKVLLDELFQNCHRCFYWWPRGVYGGVGRWRGRWNCLAAARPCRCWRPPWWWSDRRRRWRSDTDRPSPCSATSPLRARSRRTSTPFSHPSGSPPRWSERALSPGPRSAPSYVPESQNRFCRSWSPSCAAACTACSDGSSGTGRCPRKLLWFWSCSRCLCSRRIRTVGIDAGIRCKPSEVRMPCKVPGRWEDCKEWRVRPDRTTCRSRKYQSGCGFCCSCRRWRYSSCSSGGHKTNSAFPPHSLRYQAP